MIKASHSRFIAFAHILLRQRQTAAAISANACKTSLCKTFLKVLMKRRALAFYAGFTGKLSAFYAAFRFLNVVTAWRGTFRKAFLLKSLQIFRNRLYYVYIKFGVGIFYPFGGRRSLFFMRRQLGLRCEKAAIRPDYAGFYKSARRYATYTVLL